MGYLRLPQSTECSRMWGVPLELATGVRKVTPNVLFSSSLTTEISWAPAATAAAMRGVHVHQQRLPPPPSTSTLPTPGARPPFPPTCLAVLVQQDL